jgi:hypothetical protein
MMGPIGGFFLPLGDSAVAYPEIYPLQTKIAREIGTALEDLVREHGAELTAPAGVRPTRAPSSVATAFPAVPAPSRAGPNAQHAIPGPGLTPREQFQSSLHTLTALDQASVLDVYQSLSVLPDSSLRALGILGRLNAGDSSAAFELEKNLPSAVSAYNVVSFFPPYLGRLDLSHDPSAAHVLARIALSETTLPGFEAQLTYALASSHLPEMLPYLIVMLGSPDSGTRDSALRGFCELVGTAPVVPRHEELSDYCPNERLGYDRELEQEDAQFWIEWWLANRDAIARTVTLPNPTAPARYSVAVRQDKVNIAVETAFRFLLSSASHKRYDYYAVADGRISPVPSSASDDPHDVVSRHLGPVDYAVFHHVVESVNAKLAELGSQSQQIRNAARMAGVRPDFKQTQAISADRKAALRAGLAELESKLSADGWQTVERYLQSHGASTAATPVAK